MDFAVNAPDQLGPILRGFRRQRGLTQKQLASRVGLTQKAISGAETHGERLSFERLLRLLGALDVELALRDRGSRQRPPAEW